MSESLYRYYDGELRFIRKFAGEFAALYPATAGRLKLDANQARDPHVERLIESFALLAARVHHKIDDEFPELTDALLSVLYPHYLSPIPSLAMVQFELDPARAELPNGFAIPRESRLKTQTVGDVACLYRTTSPVTLWPIGLLDAKLRPPPFQANWQPPSRTAAALRFELECQSNLRFEDLTLDSLRFHIADDNQVVGQFYELILNRTTQVLFRSLDSADANKAVILPGPAVLSPAGFEREAALLPYPNVSFLGYRLLTEFFAFPSKFHFFDLGGWKEIRQAGMGRRMEVVLFLDKSSADLERLNLRNTFRLGCTPAINLFEHEAQPIALDYSKNAYRILLDVNSPLGFEVHSVESVQTITPQYVKNYRPFYSFRHAADASEESTFWYGARQPSTVKDDRGYDWYLHLVDLNFNPSVPAEEKLDVKVLCTNRDLPARFQRQGEVLNFELEMAGPLMPIRCLRPPTAPLRPPPKRGVYWRLLSHLNLNYLAITDTQDGLDALKELLRLYDFSEAETGRQLADVVKNIIDGILRVSSRRVVGRTAGHGASSFSRGIEVTVEFDEEKYVGTGVFLFASVLERFFALYSSINSFSQFVAKTQQTKGDLRRWPPRAGEELLI